MKKMVVVSDITGGLRITQLSNTWTITEMPNLRIEQ